MPMYPPQGGGPDVRGGNDPARSAIMSRLRRNGGGAGAQPAAAAMPQASPGGVPGQTNEVAFHLARAYEALTRTGPTEENLAALQGFMAQLQELAPPEAAPAQAPMVQPQNPIAQMG